jgi:hypothetical protein
MPAYVGLCGTESHQCAARRQPVRCSVIAVLCCTYVFQPHHLANVGLHYAPESVHGSILQSRFVFVVSPWCLQTWRLCRAKLHCDWCAGLGRCGVLAGLCSRARFPSAQDYVMWMWSCSTLGEPNVSLGVLILNSEGGWATMSVGPLYPEP